MEGCKGFGDGPLGARVGEGGETGDAGSGRSSLVGFGPVRGVLTVGGLGGGDTHDPHHCGPAVAGLLACRWGCLLSGGASVTANAAQRLQPNLHAVLDVSFATGGGQPTAAWAQYPPACLPQCTPPGVDKVHDDASESAAAAGPLETP